MAGMPQLNDEHLHSNDMNLELSAIQISGGNFGVSIRAVWPAEGLKAGFPAGHSKYNFLLN